MHTNTQCAPDASARTITFEEEYRMGEHSHVIAEMVDHRGRLASVLGITVTVMIVEVIGALTSGSLALLAVASSGH